MVREKAVRSAQAELERQVRPVGFRSLIDFRMKGTGLRI